MEMIERNKEIEELSDKIDLEIEQVSRLITINSYHLELYKQLADLFFSKVEGEMGKKLSLEIKNCDDLADDIRTMYGRYIQLLKIAKVKLNREKVAEHITNNKSAKMKTYCILVKQYE